MAKLDDFLSKKKETAPVLDLSKATANSSEEFRRLLDKVPDFKIKPEKVPLDTIKIQEKNFKFKAGKKEFKISRLPYLFANPLPLEMQNLKIRELAAVPIEWKMLTTSRPKSKLEEQYFSRLIELGKLEIKTRAQERRQFMLEPQIRKLKNKSGIIEMRVVSCKDCGEDFCNGKACSKFNYDSFARVQEVPKVAQEKAASVETGKGESAKRKIKRKSRSKSKSGQKKSGKSKSKSPKRNLSKSKNK